MHEKRKYGVASASVFIALIWSLVINWIMTLVGCGVMTILLSEELVGDSAIAVMTIGAMLLSAFGGAIVAAQRAEGRRMVICLLSGGAYLLSLIGANILFFDNGIHGFVPALLMIFGISVTVGLLGLWQKPSRFRGFSRNY